MCVYVCVQRTCTQKSILWGVALSTAVGQYVRVVGAGAGRWGEKRTLLLLQLLNLFICGGLLYYISYTRAVRRSGALQSCRRWKLSLVNCLASCNLYVHCLSPVNVHEIAPSRPELVCFHIGVVVSASKSRETLCPLPFIKLEVSPQFPPHLSSIYVRKQCKVLIDIGEREEKSKHVTKHDL